MNASWDNPDWHGVDAREAREAREARHAYDPDADARDGREDFDAPLEERSAGFRRAVFAAYEANAGGAKR